MLLGGIRYLLPVIETAHKLGYYVITADYLPDNIAHKYSDEYVNVSIIDKDAVLRVAKEKQIDGILSFAVDPGVISAAYVAEQMNLPYQCSYTAARILQNKALFREFLRNNGFNCPEAKGYCSINSAIKDAEGFTWPKFVKPVDSAGSKGVMKVDCFADFESAIKRALSQSITQSFIVEDYLDIVGYQSSADVFVRDGKLVYPSFSDQLFDPFAENPYTPAIEIWPSSMPTCFQDQITNELQRLFDLLEVKSGLFNVESRVCSDGKAYLMEVSPRAGGNRIAELQTRATGQDLIINEIRKAMGESIDSLSSPSYSGTWCNFILHSNKVGILDSISIDSHFREQHVEYEEYAVKHGDEIGTFTGANGSLGTLFLRTESRSEMDRVLSRISDFVSIDVK